MYLRIFRQDKTRKEQRRINNHKTIKKTLGKAKRKPSNQDKNKKQDNNKIVVFGAV